MSIWLRILLIVGTCSGITGCGNQSVLKPEEVRLGLPTALFVNSPFFVKTFNARLLEQVQLDSLFQGETTSKYKVLCFDGFSQIIRITPPEKFSFSREGAMRQIAQVMPRPGLKLLETDSEDLEKLDSKHQCEHLYFEDGVYAELHYTNKDAERVTTIQVFNRTSEMPL